MVQLLANYLFICPAFKNAAVAHGFFEKQFMRKSSATEFVDVLHSVLKNDHDLVWPFDHRVPKRFITTVIVNGECRTGVVDLN